jgi:hypothetical protein
VFTENETNPAVFGEDTVTEDDRAAGRSSGGYFKDAFHRYLVGGETGAVQSDAGTKAAAVYRLDVPPGGQVFYYVIRRLSGPFKPTPAPDLSTAERTRLVAC